MTKNDHHFFLIISDQAHPASSLSRSQTSQSRLAVPTLIGPVSPPQPPSTPPQRLSRLASPLLSSDRKPIHLNSAAPTKVMIYHASNLAWATPDRIEDAVHAIISPRPHPISNIKVAMCWTPKLEDVLSEVKKRNHAHSIVIISVMTNNAKAKQSVSHSQSLLQSVFDELKTQISPHNIIFLESPPSLNFDIYPYNRAAYHTCHNSQIYFAPNLLTRSNIKPDGLHILARYKHLMVKSVSTAIKKMNPYVYFGFPFSPRRPFSASF